MARRVDGGLQVRVGTDLGTLADDLATRLSSSPLSVLEPELVVVPTPGIRQWLEARLARRLGAAGEEDGISSNIDFVFFDGLLRRVAGRGSHGDDPWSLDRLTLLAVDLLVEAPDDDPIARLRPPGGEPGLFDAARSSADLFDQLFRWRPDVAERWLVEPGADPRAPLLRAVAERLGAPVPWRATDDRLRELLEGRDDGLDLPARLHLFGGDSLPGGPLLPRLLDALGAVRDVCMHVVVASVPRFEQVRRATPAFGAMAPDRQGTAGADEHPLLRSWGVPGRETAMLLAQLPERPTTSIETVDATPTERSLLDAVRAAIRGDDVESATAPPDRSIEVHGCVGERRQVEVLRDAILHALADLPDVEPRDVVVLCADLPRFAPHLEAVLGDPQGAPLLPYLITDRSLARAVPLVASTSRALRLLGGRYPRSAVLDLLRDPFVQARFEISEEDVERYGEWTDDGIVRWGLDGAHRGSTQLPPAFEAGTWRRTLDRLLVGTALPRGAVAPALALRALDPGYDVERVGALCSVVATLSSLEDQSGTPRSIVDWCEFARELAGSLFDPTFTAAGQLERLHRLLAEIGQQAEGLTAELPFTEFRDLFDDRASSERTRASNGPGGVTVTSLIPLRNVPFDVVAVLGMDERALQRMVSVDVAFGPARVGDRDPRADLRAALLGAILAARTRLIVTHESSDIVTNQGVPTSTALSELLESVGSVCEGGADAVSFVHPRHAHGTVDLVSDARFGNVPFSFDRSALERAISLRVAPTGERDDVAATPEPSSADGELEAAELVNFLNAPQRAYLRESLGVWVPNPAELPGDDLATSLGPLEKWGVTRDLVVEGSTSMPLGEFEVSVWNEFLTSWASTPDSPVSGLAGRLASDALRGKSGAGTRAAELLKHLRGKEKDREARTLECRTELTDGSIVKGTPKVYGDDMTIHWTASGDEGRIRLASTVDLLLLTATFPEVQWRAIRIWRKGNVAASKASAVNGATPAERRAVALSSLERLVAVRRLGLVGPIPMFGRVTTKLLTTLEDRDATPAQLIVSGLAGWTIFNSFGDGDEAAVKYCFPISYEAVCALPPQPGDPVPRHDAGGSRMLHYALTVCEALLDLSSEPPR